MKKFIRYFAVLAYFIGGIAVFSQSDPAPQMGGDDFRMNYEDYRLNNYISDNEASYSGDLMFSIPLLTVPGRNGHDFTIKIDYNSNIHQMQFASWVGLGWDLDVGYVERTVNGRTDEPEHNFNYGDLQNYNIGDYDRGNLDGRFLSQTRINYLKSTYGFSSLDVADLYQLSIDGGGMEMLPCPATLSGYLEVSSSPIEFVPVRYQQPLTTTAELSDEGFLSTFKVTKIDGTQYEYGGLSNIYTTEWMKVTEIPRTSFYHKYEYPYRWNLNKIEYPDGSATTVEYSFQNDENNRYQDRYSTVMLDRSEFFTPSENYFGQINSSIQPDYALYEYSHPIKIKTDTHYLVFETSSNTSSTTIADNTKRNCRLDAIILYDKFTNEELKRVVFHYATTNNPDTEPGSADPFDRPTGRTWQSDERLKDNQLTLIGVTIYNSNNLLPLDQNSADCQKYHFTYGTNPGVYPENLTAISQSPQIPEWPGYFTNDAVATAWRLKTIMLPTGGRYTYNYEMEEVKYDPEGSENTDIENGWEYSSEPRCRLKSKVFEDGFDAARTWNYEYSSDVVYDPPSYVNQSSYIPEMYRIGLFTSTKDQYYKFYRGCGVGHRWVKVVNPDNTWKKLYYTSSYQENDADVNENMSDIVSGSNMPTSTEEVIMMSRAGGRGIVWKEETGTSSTVSTTTINNYTYHTQGKLRDRYDYFTLLGINNAANQYVLRTSLQAILNSQTVTQDGITRTVSYQYNPSIRAGSNGLVNTITEEGNTYNKETILNYAYEDNTLMEDAGMLSQISMKQISQSGTIKSQEYTTWGGYYNSNMWLPVEKYMIDLDGTGTEHYGTTLYEYDNLGYGKVIKVTDPNGNITKYYYSSNESNPYSNDATGLTKGKVTGVEYPITTPAIKVAYKYDIYGNVIEKQDENGVSTFADYDDLGRLSSVQVVNTSTILNEYSYYMPDNASLISSADPSYIMTKDYSSATDYVTTKRYFDGAGYVRQNSISFGDNDIILPTEYDKMWRIKKVYKPYEISLGSNKHSYDPNYLSNDVSYYNSSIPYVETDYYDDGTGREQYDKPEGEGWANNYLSYTYSTNSIDRYSSVIVSLHEADMQTSRTFTVATNQTITYTTTTIGGTFYIGTTAGGSDVVSPTTSSTSGSFIPTAGTTYYITAETNDCSGGGHCDYSIEATVIYDFMADVPGYAEGTLFKTVIEDENGNLTAEYKDKLGNIVSKIMDYNGENLQTLFEYDVMGHLIKVKPPKGIIENSDRYNTTYSYNSLGQLVRKSTPDEDGNGNGNSTDETSASSSLTDYEYKYDEAGNLRFVLSPNGRAGDYFIYNKYDALNRLIETGTYSDYSTYFTDANAKSTTFPASGNVVQVNYYDQEPGYGSGVWSDAVSPGTMSNLKNRIAAVAYLDESTGDFGYTYYSYNQRGNVKVTYQDLPGDDLEVKKTQYSYDYQDKITYLLYQSGSSDQFYCKYEYDAAGRLSKVYANTSNSFDASNVVAEYIYNADGQCSRAVYGGTAQGVDYTYNIRGWVTQINHQNLGGIYEGEPQDPGRDGYDSGVTVDRFGEIIGYNIAGHIGDPQYQDAVPQYNGNVSWMIWRNGGLTTTHDLVGYTFDYDKANRLLSSDYGYYNSGWLESNKNDEKGLSYDANGNIMSLTRYDVDGNLRDNLIYRYLNTWGNKLRYVDDYVSSSLFDDDFDDLNPGDYAYNRNGSLTKDLGKDIKSIRYDIRNLPYQMSFGAEEDYLELIDIDIDDDEVFKAADDIVTINEVIIENDAIVKFIAGESITLGAGFSVEAGCTFTAEVDPSLNTVVKYAYDAAGKRVKKNNSITGDEKYYIRDASGNVISVYDENGSQKYANLIGENVFGNYIPGEGYYYYIKDHLGSTRVVVDGSGAVAEAYEYYPFGSISRSALVNKYDETDEKFTGKELDNENGENLYYFGARYYNSDLGRWMGIDPLGNKEPDFSPYVYVGNNPLSFVDPNGEYRVNSDGTQVTRVTQELYDRVNFLGYCPGFWATVTIVAGKALTNDPSFPVTAGDLTGLGLGAFQKGFKYGGELLKMTGLEVAFINGNISLGGSMASILDLNTNEESQNDIILDKNTFLIASDIGLGSFSTAGAGSRILTINKTLDLNKEEVDNALKKLQEEIKKKMGDKSPSETSDEEWEKIRESFKGFNVDQLIEQKK